MRNKNQYNNILVSQMASLNAPVGSKELNAELYPKVVAGDQEAREMMIHANMPLVLNCVESFILTFPSAEFLRDDMVSAGFVGLVDAVNRFSTNEAIDNPTGYITVAVSREIGKLVDDEGSIRVPSRTKHHKKVKGEDVDIPERLDDFPETIEDSTHALEMVELRDTLASCCESDEERDILRMREANYVDREIADVLGLPLTTTYMLRRTLYQRFLDKTGMKGEV